MAKKTEIITDDYFHILEKVKKRIVEVQYRVMTTADVERNILYWNIGKVIVNTANGEVNLLKVYQKTCGWNILELRGILSAI